ncbi:hypothetical protein QYE76_017073 [Lolium multiflorum]|uniref:Uncharacterized protein n=1 Tax=Lolium multiflorum TaxID=4521 RepID=A0AAD8QBI0_LOLMU|nr:hypothetical protein QYE76_017073 [Lolium multiflorum]
MPEHVVKKLTPDMRSLHETVLHVENLLLKSKDPPLFLAKVPTGMNFVEKYPADLCFIRFNDISASIACKRSTLVWQPDNGMDAWYAILRMQEYIKYADDMLLDNLKTVNRGCEFFYGYGLPPNDEIDLRLEMSRDERPFNSLEGCRPFPPRRTT